MKLEIYSKKPLDISLRSTFELPYFPYSEDPERRFEKYLESLGIFYYNDDFFSKKFPESFSDLVDLDGAIYPFDAYHHTVFISNKTLKVVDWPEDYIHKFGKQLRANPVTADMKAWRNWNIHKTVEGFSNGILVTGIPKNSKPANYITAQMKTPKIIEE